MDKKIFNVYIDGNNLHRASQELGFDIDYKKFKGWLWQKYCVDKVYIFIGFIKSNTLFYELLQDCGFVLIFKEVISRRGVVKGNCDAELIVKIISDFYNKEFDDCCIITGDGDFGCIVDFFQKNEVRVVIIAPNENKCSIFLRNKNVEIIFLNDHYQKFSKEAFKKEKAPDADVSA